jgi:hypothetical protein
MPVGVPYYNRLVQIRTILEEALTGFPEDWCCETAQVVSADLGLNEIIGYHCPRRKKNSIFRAYHVWNYDSERKLYIDLTHDQFGDFPPIFIFSSLQEQKLEQKKGKNIFHPETVDKIITRLNQP